MKELHRDSEPPHVLVKLSSVGVVSPGVLVCPLPVVVAGEGGEGGLF